MAEFMFGMRRMLGLTSPAEEADFEARQQMVQQEAMRGAQVQPGTALQERQQLLDSSMQELRRQNAVVPASAPAAPPPAQPAPSLYGGEAGGAMEALKGYGTGVRSTISPAMPPKRKEDEIKINVNPGWIRG